MNTFSIICLVLALASVVAVLCMGIFSMMKGGEYNKKNANKFMQWRVYLQGLALGLLALAYFTSQS